MSQIGPGNQFYFAFGSDWSSCEEFLEYGARDNMKPGMKLKSLDVYVVHFVGRCYWIDYSLCINWYKFI